MWSSSSGYFDSKGNEIPFGYFSVMDWLWSVVVSFDPDWTVAPLDGKYYGTTILDSRGKRILSFWYADSDDVPSSREKEDFGREWTPEAWNEYGCDSHWESERALSIAERVVKLRNAAGIWTCSELIDLILKHGRWDPSVYPEIACGGPSKRPGIQRR